MAAHKKCNGTIPHGEIDDCGILLREKSVLCEALDVDNQILRQFGDLKLFHKQILVRFVLLRRTTGCHVGM